MGSGSIPLWRVVELTGDDGNGYQFGMDSYPIYDSTQRDSLNRKIVDHYWNREIGQDSISMFKHYMRTTLNEQMPLFNQLYRTTQLEFDPLSTYALSTVRNGTATENGEHDSTGSNDSTTTSSSRAVQSTTPQNQLSGKKDYATGISDTNSSTSTDAKTTGKDTSLSNTTTTDNSTTSGRQGSASALLLQYRATLLNIDRDVIDAVAVMFMLAFDLEPRRPEYTTYGGLYR